MNTILEVDMGNSRSKWRLLGGPVFPEVQASNDLLETWVASGLAQLPIDRVRVSSVVGAEQTLAVVEWCRCHLHVEVELAKVRSNCGGFHQGYEQPEQLGVDRWLACLAAWYQTQGACAVMSFGTAITLDCIDASGYHRGGFIVPGIKLLQGVLADRTSGIRLDNIIQLSEPLPGHSTQSCVEAGLAAMLSGLLKLVDTQSPLYICGGDRDRVTALLPATTVVCDTLVLDGLALALP